MLPIVGLYGSCMHVLGLQRQVALVAGSAVSAERAAGSSRAPATGFKGMRTPLTITRAGEERLPSSHTCANQLVLSEYKDQELLRKHLHDVLKQPAGFHFR